MQVTVKKLLDAWDWKPIKNCPGRFTLCRTVSVLSFTDLLGSEQQIQKFCSPQAKDEVLVVKLKDGGLITYSRLDGNLIHTLNTEEGFHRKLAQLKITL
ncbi:hypothetical protein [Candidatus Nitrospira salsa]